MKLSATSLPNLTTPLLFAGTMLALCVSSPLVAFAQSNSGDGDAQITVRRSIIVKVPIHTPHPRTRWVEKNSRKCVNIDSIAGASVHSPQALDLLMRSGDRWRLKFKNDCTALTFYRGFYLRPGEDRQICAKRDVIHPRSGGECEIQNFRHLKLEIDD